MSQLDHEHVEAKPLLAEIARVREMMRSQSGGRPMTDHAAWLDVIADVCVDYDGFRSVDGLKELIDEVREMCLAALRGEPVPYEEED